MANIYRMVHTEPYKIVIQMQTASGWIDSDTAGTVAEAKEKIRQRKAKEDWVVKIYDENGDNMVEANPPANQPVQPA